MFLNRKSFSSIHFIFIFYAFLVFITACATIVAPTGGPKDEKPPVILKSDPPSGSTNFKSNKITLRFNEYVTLNNLEKFFIISPPVKNTPNIRITGKSVVIKFEEPLRPNTTYNMFFGDAIVDNNEGNPLKNYAYSFSTGNVIDTLSVSGKVINAFTLDSLKDISVMLYKNFADSVPFQELPVYITRTDEKGNFTLRSLAQGNYKLVAIADKNSDFMYTPTEMVGFFKDTVHLKANNKDTSLYTVGMFTSHDSVQRIAKYEMPTPEKLYIAFKYPVKNPEISATDAKLGHNWGIKEWSVAKDTLTVWLKQKSNNFSLIIEATGFKKDTLNFIAQQKLPSKKQVEKEKESYNLSFYSTISNGALSFNGDLIFTFRNPLDTTKFQNIKISEKKTKKNIETKIFFTDSIKRNLLIKHNWQPDVEYSIFVPRGTFVDMYGSRNDSVNANFTLVPRSQYGDLKANINIKDSVAFPVIVQLLNEKGDMVKQEIIGANKTVIFDLLTPNRYRIKAIFDKNRNNRWDGGDLLKKIQPEQVVIKPKTFEVRANWELTEDWNF